MQVSGECEDRSSRSALRLEARQDRLGIIANPAQVDLPVLPPRDVWTRWPKLRSARRRDALRDPSPERWLAHDPILSGQKLEAFMSELRNGPEDPVAGDTPNGAIKVAGSGPDRPHGRAGKLPAGALPALLVALALVAGLLAWVYGGAG